MAGSRSTAVIIAIALGVIGASFLGGSRHATAAKAAPLPTPTSCSAAELPGKVAIKSQSFAFNSKPFEGSCFVTYAEKDQMLDAKDLPRGSTFHIEKDGKVVYDLPDAFDKQPGCWVEGVGFSDLNGDGLTDIIIAGRCLAAHDSYGQNAIYMNNGSAFDIRSSDAGSKFNDLKTVKSIEAYVKAHPKGFF